MRAERDKKKERKKEKANKYATLSKRSAGLKVSGIAIRGKLSKLKARSGGDYVKKTRIII